MATPLHSKQTTADGIHTAISYTYADATARTGATGFTVEDLGKLAWQLDNNTIWLLLAITPVWAAIAGVTASGSAKSGVAAPGSFSGNPKKSTVTFASAYPSTAYAVAAIGVTDGSKAFAVAVESKTAGGFILNLHSNNLANLVEVGWHTILTGEF